MTWWTPERSEALAAIIFEAMGWKPGEWKTAQCETKQFYRSVARDAHGPLVKLFSSSSCAPAESPTSASPESSGGRPAPASSDGG